jgi:GNAT superfamily N-acetyltransferase
MLPSDAAFLDGLTVRQIGGDIDLSKWDCNGAIDWFLKNQACDFHDKRLAAVTCWLAGNDLSGFATTNMSLLEVESGEERQKMGIAGILVREGGRQYRVFPALLIGVLGVCARYRRKGLGERMVKFSIGQALSSGVGCRFVIVDSEPTEEAVRLYDKCGFRKLESQDKKRDTVRMYYDLLVPSAPATEPARVSQ